MDTHTTLADLATTRPGAVTVFHRHGLDFCCGGRRPLDEACRSKGLDPVAVLVEIAREASMADPARRWDLAPLPDLIQFIVAHYHDRLRHALPDLVRMAGRVEVRHGDKPDCPLGLTELLERLKVAVIEHLDKEEQVLFPMMLRGNGSLASGPVHVMELEHDDVARLLRDVRGLTGDLHVPEAACTTWRALYLGLQRLELELMEHIHLENNVLFRRALVA